MPVLKGDLYFFKSEKLSINAAVSSKISESNLICCVTYVKFTL